MANISLAWTILPLLLLIFHCSTVSSVDASKEYDNNDGRVDGAAPISPYDVEEVRAGLQHHRNMWRSFVGDNNNYSMNFQRICYCPEQWRGPFSIRVRHGEIESATYLSESLKESTVDPELLVGLLTVEDMFDEIQKGLDRNYADLQVTYDETIGYPISISIDTSRMIADDEMTFRVSDVVHID